MGAWNSKGSVLMNDEMTLNSPMPVPSVEMVLRDGGRRVAVHRLAHGDTDRTLVLCHIAPGSATFDPQPEQTRARRVTLLAVDRPGYGQSDPMPDAEWASVSSAADDVAAMLDRTVHRPVGVAGWSAGGRVALALAARRPDLVDRVVVLATPAPNDQVPWIPPEQQTVLESLRGRTPDAVRAVLSEQLGQLIPDKASAADSLSLLGASDADSTVLATPGARARLIEMLQAAFAQGIVGLASDMAGYCLQPWGFEPEAVQAKTLLLYGSRDPIAGPQHGRWWQKHLPNTRLEVVPDAGHLLIVTMWQRVLTHLAPNTKR
jgi:pimeloyl-ACP methyl ester carboxylesterase